MTGTKLPRVKPALRKEDGEGKASDESGVDFPIAELLKKRMPKRRCLDESVRKRVRGMCVWERVEAAELYMYFSQGAIGVLLILRTW